MFKWYILANKRHAALRLRLDDERLVYSVVICNPQCINKKYQTNILYIRIYCFVCKLNLFAQFMARFRGLIYKRTYFYI
jgi:hypothetical protein